MPKNEQIYPGQKIWSCLDKVDTILTWSKKIMRLVLENWTNLQESVITLELCPWKGSIEAISVGCCSWPGVRMIILLTILWHKLYTNGHKWSSHIVQ